MTYQFGVIINNIILLVIICSINYSSVDIINNETQILLPLCSETSNQQKCESEFKLLNKFTKNYFPLTIILTIILGMLLITSGLSIVYKKLEIFACSLSIWSWIILINITTNCARTYHNTQFILNILNNRELKDCMEVVYTSSIVSLGFGFINLFVVCLLVCQKIR